MVMFVMLLMDGWWDNINKMNKLDLVFQKEPPEVQRKLMNLLLQYNAVMQYNPQDEKFEVDILLPFEDSSQKEHFLRNFSARNHRTEPNRPAHASRKNSEHYSHQAINTHQQQPNGISEPKHPQQQSHSVQPQSQQRQEDPEVDLSFQLTNQHETSMKREAPLSLSEISNIIRQKLTNAVTQIRAKQSFSQNMNSGDVHSSGEWRNITKRLEFNDEENQSVSKDEEGSIVHQIYQNGSQGILPPTNHHQLHESERKNYEYYPDTHAVKVSDYASENNSMSGAQSSSKNEILIEEDEEGVLGSAIMSNNHSSTYYNDQYQQDDSHASAGNYSSNYERPHIIEQRMEEDDEELFSKDEKRKRDMMRVQEMKNKLNQKYQNNKKMTSSGHNLRAKYKDFLKKNHRDIDRLYETIRKDIKRNESQLKMSRKNDPILVLESDMRADSSSEEDRIFKEEIIKEYQSHILAQNQNMSSEDLVRYFRYLVQHAKSLYVKQLRKGR